MISTLYALNFSAVAISRVCPIDCEFPVPITVPERFAKSFRKRSWPRCPGGQTPSTVWRTLGAAGGCGPCKQGSPTRSTSPCVPRDGTPASADASHQLGQAHGFVSYLVRRCALAEDLDAGYCAALGGCPRRNRDVVVAAPDEEIELPA